MEQQTAAAEDGGIYDYKDLEDSQKDKYLTFNIDAEDYGIEIRNITEIVVLQEITQVPNMPVYQGDNQPEGTRYIRHGYAPEVSS